MTQFGYYPGCALHGSSNDYEKSLKACMAALSVEFKELEEWLCCGATAAHSLNAELSEALPARNLGLAEQQSIDELLAPCPLCSIELRKVSGRIRQDTTLRKHLSDVVEIPLEGKTNVINLIQVFQKIGIDTLKAAVKNPLNGLSAACYYGCMLTRPPEVAAFDDVEQPSSMESILEALGATAIAWNFKTECCGAGMTLCNETLVAELAHRILDNAQKHGAECLVVACPMCQMNLDMRQSAIEKLKGIRHDLPIYYLSDLVGLALGLDQQTLGIDRHFVTKSKAVK